MGEQLAKDEFMQEGYYDNKQKNTMESYDKKQNNSMS